MKKIFYTTSYCAARIGVTVGAIRQWIAAGRIKPDAIAYGADSQLPLMSEKDVKVDTLNPTYLWTNRTIYNARRAWLAGKL